MSGPVIVNNPDRNNSGLLLGIVLTIVVLAGAWYFIFGPGASKGGGNGNGGDNNPVPTVAAPQGS